MANFTQLGLSGEPNKKPNAVTNTTRHQPLIGGKQKLMAYVVTVVVTSLLGIFLLQTGGCSREQSRTIALAPGSPAPVAQNSAVAMPAVAPPIVKEPVRVAKKRTARTRPLSVTYADQAYGVTFVYPRKYMLLTGDDAKLQASTAEPVSMNFVQDGGTTVASLLLPDGLYPGTDLSSAFLNVSVNPALSEEQCSQFALPASTDKGSAEPAKLKLGETEFQEVEDIAGQQNHQADAKYYHVFQNNVCYEFALGVSTAVDEDKDAITPVDREDVFHRLEKILATVKIKTEAAPEVKAELPATVPQTQDLAAK